SHIYANFLNKPGISLPSIALVVSGGHTSLFYVKDPGQVKTLGATLDDACGESFDKVAKILGLGYPGGPLIERLAKKGDPGKIKFNCSATRHPFDFSFSGIKTAVLYHVRGSPRASSVSRVPYAAACDIAASFQESVIGALVKKSLLACKIKKMPRLIIGGGVAANSRLRERFFHQAKKEGVSVSFPPLEFCTDNAAMVAGLGSWLFTNGQHSGLGLSAAT
ncbi:MAG: tRNA (adenosine(37)-N6)-threonylcarbamoyltransferase complex transferase subunit TsaD, partial [Candidatus Omnitrophica bacterium]|nr:tRNA (adenosine(37)-N6)-threonylcarbamoyltransferase complex transferase subunit TsaD [Candidatus Omnitrophota bacterium]